MLLNGLEYNKRYILGLNLKDKLPGGRVSIFSLNLRVKYIVYCTTNRPIRNLSSSAPWTLQAYLSYCSSPTRAKANWSEIPCIKHEGPYQMDLPPKSDINDVSKAKDVSNKIESS